MPVCSKSVVLLIVYRLQFVKLKAFSKFDNTTEALAAATALVESKLSKGAHQRLLCYLPAAVLTPLHPGTNYYLFSKQCISSSSSRVA
jgi:hypothetical protein